MSKPVRRGAGPGVTGSGACPARRGDLVRSGRPPSFRTWWALFRVQLKVGLPISPRAFASRRSARLGWNEWLWLFLTALSFLILSFVVLVAASESYEVLAVIGQADAMLTIFFGTALMLLLMFGLVSIASTFFFARDLPQLVSLPLPAGTIVSAKLATVLVNQWLSMIFLVPAVAVYGVRQGVATGYWLKAAAVLLLLPLPTLALAAVLAVGLVRLAGRTRHRDWVVVAGSLVTVGVLLVAQIVPYSVLRDVDAAQLGRALGNLAGLVGRYSPPALWATRALATGAPFGGIGHLLLLASTGAGALAVAGWLGHRLFFRSLAASLESPKRLPAGEAGGAVTGLARRRSPFRALLWREWAVLWRTPTFAMNTLLPMVLFPLTLALSWWMGMGNGAEVFRHLEAQLTTPSARAWSAVLGVAATTSAGLFGFLGASALSREGRAFWVSQILPVPAHHQVAAKLLFACAVSWVGGMPLGAAVGLPFRWTPALWAYWLVTAFLGVVAVNALQLALDLWRPKLDWTDPRGAVGYNFNVLLAMLAGAACLGGMGVVAFLASAVGPAFRLAAVFAYLLLLAAGSTVLVLGASKRAYRVAAPPS
ncbi:MAG: hypothetical protein DIU69_00780 [Bacillota bacterium]|nr:MAG: hypothetical protein DIU69_00780 [Bacillota bacterium]